MAPKSLVPSSSSASSSPAAAPAPASAAAAASSAGAAAALAAAPLPPASVLAWLLTPDPALSFAFLCGAYALLAALAGVFAALQFLGGVKAVSGMWIVPLPAAIALPYVFALWRIQRAQALSAAAAKKAR